MKKKLVYKNNHIDPPGLYPIISILQTNYCIIWQGINKVYLQPGVHGRAAAPVCRARRESGSSAPEDLVAVLFIKKMPIQHNDNGMVIIISLMIINIENTFRSCRISFARHLAENVS